MNSINSHSGHPPKNSPMITECMDAPRSSPSIISVAKNIESSLASLNNSHSNTTTASSIPGTISCNNISSSSGNSILSALNNSLLSRAAIADTTAFQLSPMPTILPFAPTWDIFQVCHLKLLIKLDCIFQLEIWIKFFVLIVGHYLFTKISGNNCKATLHDDQMDQISSSFPDFIQARSGTVFVIQQVTVNSMCNKVWK